jgi:hypothetical protein
MTHRKIRFNKDMDDTGRWLLATAEEIRKRCDGLDTAVRDSVAEGIAYIVQAGNDCMASNLDLTTDQWMSFIDKATADWFRSRGYAEWFAVGAATGFNRSRPRILDDRCFNVVRRTPKRKPRKKAAPGK